MRLLGKRIEQPTYEELLQLIREGQKSAESSVESDIRETIARYDRLKKKEAALMDIRSLSKQYLSKNVASQKSPTGER
jgi:phosphoenolpyruvate-protein kinase (PTS system EI component)